MKALARLAALLAALAALGACGLESGGLLPEDVPPAGDTLADADGTVGADADATTDGPPETTDGAADGADADASDDATTDDAATDDAATGDGTACVPGATRPCEVPPGACPPGQQTCTPLGAWGDCVSLGPPPAAEVCDGLDNDCNGLADDMGTTTCGTGACEVTVENCVAGAVQACVPPDPTVCDAPPAYCHETTTGTNECGEPCTKVGPDHCYTVHPACLDSSPGAPTDEPECTTPRDRYNCGLTCEEWPNTIGADCVYCVNIYCRDRPGLDEAQFRCRNIPVPPTE